MRNLKRSEFNQPVIVNKITGQAKQPDGTIKNTFGLRFRTSFANITIDKSLQQYKEGVSEKDTYYRLKYEYAADRVISITDQILWNGKVLKPIGDCVADNEGNKKIFVQKIKYTSV